MVSKCNSAAKGSLAVVAASWLRIWTSFLALSGWTSCHHLRRPSTPSAAKKNRTVRISANFKTGLNELLETHRHPLPTPEEIFSHLNQGAWFIQIALADAYLQMEVNDDSKELGTINTHRVYYQYQRLPFGVKCVPDIFQEAMDGMRAGLQGCAAYLDDIIVTGTTLEEYNRNVHALFKRIAECGFRVRMEKCSFAKKEIKFLGNLISRDGRRPDSEKIHAIVEMPPPKDRKQLKILLGHDNFLFVFCSRDAIHERTFGRPGKER